MVVAGHCFSPLDSTDLFFKKYLDGKYGKAKNLFELTNLAFNAKCDTVFTFSEK